jgi:hypothetical protein
MKDLKLKGRSDEELRKEMKIAITIIKGIKT